MTGPSSSGRAVCNGLPATAKQPTWLSASFDLASHCHGPPSGRAGRADYTIRVWDARSGQPRGEPLAGHTGPVVALAVGQIDEDPVIVSGSDDNTVRVWDGRSGQPRGEPLAGHSREGMPSGIRVALVQI